MAETTGLGDPCASCPRLIVPRERILQLVHGTYQSGFITPTLDEIIAEWHLDCFKEYPLRPQRQPYRCMECKETVNDGEAIFYGCIGTKPDVGYLRSESR